MINKSLSVTILGFVGFSIGCFTLFGDCGNSKSKFHEVRYVPEEIAREMLRDKKDSLIKETAALVLLRKSLYADSKSTAKIDSISGIITKDSGLLIEIEKYYFISTADSLHREKAESFLKAYVDLDLLTEFNSQYLNDTSKAGLTKIPFNFSFYDTAIEVGESHKSVELSIYDFKSDVDLFSKYPGFGVWALLILLFCCCFAMTVGFCINSGNELSALTANKVCEKPLSYRKSVGICFALLGFFVAAIYFSFYDSDAIKDLYFMKGLGTRIGFISIFGYTTAAFCFAGMISTASYAHCFRDRIQSVASEQAGTQTVINEEIVKLSSSLEIESDIPPKKEIETKLQSKKDQLKASQMIIDSSIADYANLKQLFRTFFYAIALLLALLVFCTGALYSAVDSLDFIKMIKNDLGFSPARHDFIWLYAALHTSLILLFYLPARSQIGGDKKKEGDLDPDEQLNSGFFAGLKTQLKNMTDVLIVGAPLVASFAQWLLNMIFEN